MILRCGSERIRTSDTLSGTTVFKTVAFNHSATLPVFELLKLCSPFRYNRFVELPSTLVRLRRDSVTIPSPAS